MICDTRSTDLAGCCGQWINVFLKHCSVSFKARYGMCYADRRATSQPLVTSLLWVTWRGKCLAGVSWGTQRQVEERTRNMPAGLFNTALREVLHVLFVHYFQTHLINARINMRRNGNMRQRKVLINEKKIVARWAFLIKRQLSFLVLVLFFSPLLQHLNAWTACTGV